VAQALLVASLYAAGYVLLSASQRLKIAMEERLFLRVADLPGLRRFEDPEWLDRLHLASEGTDRASEIFTFSHDSVRAAITFAGFATPLVVIWPPMALLLIAAAVPAVISQINQIRRRAHTAQVVAEAYRRQYFYRGLLVDLGAAKELRAFGFGRGLHRRMIDTLTGASRAELAVERTATRHQLVIAVLGACVTGAGIMVVVLGAARGRFTVGDVAFFIAAVSSFEGTVSGVINGAGQLGRNVFLFSQYLEVVSTDDDLVDGETEAGPLVEGIQLDDVWFRYDEGCPWVIQGFSLFIPKGWTVGVVGLNGAGKSTMVKLLCRFYDPDRGAIRWDRHDLRELDVASLRRRMSVTFQDFVKYELSAKENISLGATGREVELAEVRRAASVVGVDQALASLPKGYDTILSRTLLDEFDGTRGVTLSGGQWQRLALARALVRRDAEVLILDEPTSGMDADAEHRIHEALSAAGDGRTRVLISHRLGGLRDADLIVVLADGRIVERGTHDELMQAEGEYARLFRLQARRYSDVRTGDAVL
jgi:ATP-binding cassette, subfamily B, bacterial